MVPNGLSFLYTDVRPPASDDLRFGINAGQAVFPCKAD
jgi:hypothetical protein